MCPYCQKDLSGLVYWVHLEEHMNSSAASPATPSKPSAAASATTPEPRSVTPLTKSAASPALRTPEPKISPEVEVKTQTLETPPVTTPKVEPKFSPKVE